MSMYRIVYTSNDMFEKFKNKTSFVRDNQEFLLPNRNRQTIVNKQFSFHSFIPCLRCSFGSSKLYDACLSPYRGDRD